MKSITKHKLCFFKDNYTEINTQLSNIDWESKLAQGDIDDLWQRFANELSITYEEHMNIPESRSMSRKYDTPRINEESKTALIKKKKTMEKI